MSEKLKKIYDSEVFRKQGHELVDILADFYAETISKKKNRVINWEEPEAKFKKWNEIFSSNSKISLKDFWKNIISDTIHIHDPKYMGHQVSASIPLSGLTELINGCINNGSAIYEMGPVSTVMEKIVIDWLLNKIEMPKESAGILTSGGSLGNLTALLACRQNIAPYDIWNEGFKDSFKPAIMVSDEAHYSIARAVKILGWGKDAIIKVPTNDSFQLDFKQLEPLYKNAEQKGLKVISVIANACTTNLGTYDPLNEIADFCETKNIWFHVDAAHGGAAALSPKYKHLTRGIERADSVVIDFHKMLGTSALTTAILFKDGKRSYETFEQQATYILQSKGSQEWFNSARRTMECTKNMMGIKVFSILKIYGEEVFIDFIDTCYDNGKKFAEFIKQQNDFDLALEPTSNIVCFRYNKANDLNEINTRIRQEILEDGEYYIVQTGIKEEIYLRVSLMNPFTGKEEFSGLLNKIRAFAN